MTPGPEHVPDPPHRPAALPACSPGRAAGRTPDGGTLPEVSRSEAKLIGRAVAGRWPMDDALRADVVETMATIVRNAGVFDPRVVASAARVLLDADRLNMEDESRATKAPDVVTGPDGRTRVDFSKLTDDELERYLSVGG